MKKYTVQIRKNVYNICFVLSYDKTTIQICTSSGLVFRKRIDNFSGIRVPQGQRKGRRRRPASRNFSLSKCYTFMFILNRKDRSLPRLDLSSTL